MRATAQRHWIRLLFVAAVLVLPAYDPIVIDAGSEATQPVPFLAAVNAHIRFAKELYADTAHLTVQPLLRTVLARARNAAPARATATTPAAGELPIVAAQPVGLGPEDRSMVVVREGQTIRDIAKAYGIPLQVLLEVNDLRLGDTVRAGEVLLLPPMGGGPDMIAPWTTAIDQAGAHPQAAQPQLGGSSQPLVVEVAEGETLWNIAQQYGITVDELVEANDLPSADMISVGQRIVVPGRTGEALRPQASRPRISRPTIAQGFVWPSRGVLRSRFGWRYVSHHDGIDISAPHGTSIYSARAGRVRFAGWYYGYGRTVIIDHGDGVTTLYGHCSQLIVRTGDIVNAGELIAKVGSTGRSTGPHLHFELRVNGRPLDPLKYL